MSTRKVALKSAGIAILLAITLLLTLFSLRIGGWKAMSVQTGSMRPAINPGDMVLVKSVPASELRVGDVVTYISPINKNETITHRIIAMNGLRLTVKGDANTKADPVVFANKVVGRQNYKVPYAGYAINFLHSWVGIAIIVYLPALLVIISEIRRLSKYYKSQQSYVAVGYKPPRPKAPSSNKQKFAITAKATTFAVVVVLAIALPVRAALMSTATLTNNSISSAVATPGHVLVQQVIFSGGSGDVCIPQGTPLGISNIGSTTTTTLVSNSNCGMNITNNTWIKITNTNNQTATSGNATGSGATSGNASSSNSTNINVNINNGGGSTNNGQAVIIYNPTSQSINLKNWTLTDNNISKSILGNHVVAAHGYLMCIWPTSNGLNVLGDRIILKAPTAEVVDAVSWGNDTTQLNPSVSTDSSVTSIVRTPPELDTDSASDWQVIQ